MSRYIGFFILFLLLSCKKDKIISFDEKRNNILGDWEVTVAVREIRADTIYKESAGTFSISFNEDGSGIIKDYLFGLVEKIDFDWLYQYNPEKILISKKPNKILLSSSADIFQITKNQKDRQIWELENTSPPDSIESVIKSTWKMKRK